MNNSYNPSWNSPVNPPFQLAHNSPTAGPLQRQPNGHISTPPQPIGNVFQNHPQMSPRTPRPLIPQSSPMRPVAPTSTPGLSQSSAAKTPTLPPTPKPANGRSLPNRDVTEDTFDDTYVAFIHYCNPDVPTEADTSLLRKWFRNNLPKSDGKIFSTYVLWELIRKLDRKELKTWGQLAIEMGVEPPSTEKGQSTQKVQQYAVRLKRWMRAMHIDAFFEYLLGKEHAYFNQVPPQKESGHSEQERDGVPMEEDLAIRALMPEWRPKRGRRKTDDATKANDKANDPDAHVDKRPHLDTAGPVDNYEYGGHSAAFPQSAIPFSAFPDDGDNPWGPHSALPFSSMSVQTAHPINGQQQNPDFRWRLDGREASPNFPYPQSAITPGQRVIEKPSINEPRSAIPTSSEKPTKARRKHGPAVSSAWPSNNTSSSGKIRGRPPSNRSTQDGPFTTFPVKPKDAETPTISVSEASGSTTSNPPTLAPAPTPTTYKASPPQNLMPGVNGSASGFQHIQAKPSKLQLQVPRHSGGPVRLATPPTVMVNGSTGGSTSPTFGNHGRRTSADFFREGDDHETETNPFTGNSTAHSKSPLPFTLSDVSRLFVARLLRAKIAGRPHPLTLEEAHLVSNKSLDHIRSLHPSPTQHEADFPATAATWLGVSAELPRYPLMKEASCSKLQISANHSQQSLNLAWTIGIPPLNQNPTTKSSSSNIAEPPDFWIDMHLVISLENHNTRSEQDFSSAHPSSAPPAQKTKKPLLPAAQILNGHYPSGPTTDTGGTREDWREKYLALEREVAAKEMAWKGYRMRVLEAAMGDLSEEA